MDEATSSLDNETELEVMEAIKAISKDLTVLIVAHRLSTIRNADLIYHMENGVVLAKGNFEELFQKSSNFRSLVNAAGGEVVK